MALTKEEEKAIKAQEELLRMHKKALAYGYAEMRAIYKAGQTVFIYVTEEIKL